MRAIDGWVNVRLAGVGWQRQVAENLFRRPASEVFKNHSAEDLLAVMDPLGVEKAIVGVNAERPEKEVVAFVERHPTRFALAAHLDPRRGMKAVRALEAVARSHPVVTTWLMPCVANLPPDDRVYYPVYAKAVELRLPVTVTTGIPGPPLPGRCQDPMHLDEVCLFFPELTVVMAHGADPWWAVAIRLMAKYPNLHLMTSAYSPKYLPAELLAFMNSRGEDKVLFGTDFPFLTMERCLKEARDLDLREDVLDKYLYQNAARVFFTAAAPTVTEPA